MKKILLIISLFLSVNLFADMMKDGSSAYEKGNLDDAISIWSKACSDGFMEACDKLGSMYYFGYGTQKDRLKAKELFLKVCISGNGEDCAKVARMYDYGYGIKQDRKKAAELYKKACDAGFKKSCRKYKELKRKGY
ncbi:tetratricopeptide repeat protein [Sulfurimonas sp. HSL-1716]|uniref:tetratricopeptide repeat protein n=1 Tax=Hydrocurvibacter sulfurireducens TaxID=3131937 RepID=UPI0031FA0655